MEAGFSVAVVGATGLVGRSMLSVLEERQFPIESFYPVASSRSAGEVLEFNKKPYYVEDLAHFDFSKVQVALFSPGAKVSAQYAPIAAAAGCVVIDNTSQFRYEPDVPLVVPEVNAHAIAEFQKRYIIANPNCSTIQMVVALKPIYDKVGIERINVVTFQSVSGSGKKGVQELVQQTGSMLNGRPATPSIYPVEIAFNVIPQIDVFQENGYTKEEMKMVWETKKIFGDDTIAVNPTCARVPVFFGHSIAVHIETREKISAEEARKILQTAEGVKVIDKRNDGGYPTAVSQGKGGDVVSVGRIREDLSHPRGLDMWIVADNVRKGAALNAVQIAEILTKDYL